MAIDSDDKYLLNRMNSVAFKTKLGDLIDAASGGGSGDITAVTAGTGLTGGGTTGAVTLNVDVGTTANKIVQLDGTAKLPAVDGSQLTNLPGGGGTPAGATGEIQFNASGAFDSDPNLFWDDTGKRFILGGLTAHTGKTVFKIASGLGNGAYFAAGTGAEPMLALDTDGTNYIELQGAESGFGGAKQLKIQPNGSTLLLGGAQLVWPNTDGSANQVLKTDGAGTLSLGPLVSQAGTTASRPGSPVLGQQYFDTDLAAGAGMPIWYNGTNWVDATGATV